MNTYQFLAHLRSMNIELAADGEQLRVNAPEGVLTRELQVELASRKADILRVLDAAQPRHRSNPPPVHRAARDGALPLSLSQQRLWFLDQLNPGQSVYNAPMAYGIRGALNVAAMERTLNELVRRHEMLRTTFQVADGQPRQEIAAELRVALPVTDLTDHAHQEREQEARRRIMEDARVPFDLQRGPLLRCHLFMLGADEHVLYVNVHHIAFDVWSLGIFAGELKALYDAYSTGDESPLAELPVQYADYAQWQREWLASGVTERQLTYWTKQLDGIPPLLELPIDQPRTGIQTYNGAARTRVLPGDLSESLRRLARRSGATPFMVMLTALQTLLYRYTGQSDVVVGTVIANRRRDELEGLIGFFVNSLALRTDLSGDPTFRDALARVRGVTLEAYDHQDLPFERLVEELQPERTMDHTPIFQVMLAFQNAPNASMNAGGLTLIGFPIATSTAKFDLSLYVDDRADGFRLTLEYNTDLFDDDTAERMLAHYGTLLRSVVENDARRVAELPILTPGERQQLVVDWNRTATDYPRDATIAELFAQRVGERPEAIAVEFESERVTYRELDRRANQLAHHLRTLGVDVEVKVGLCLERSVDLVVAVLGILKAGGTYVPLDMDYPIRRIEWMLEDSSASVLLTQATLRERFPAGSTRIVCVDEDWDAIAGYPESAPDVDAGARDLAYVMYTSGSTGRPKGTCVEHRAVVRLVRSTNYLDFGPDEVFLQLAPVSFDASTLELWGALLNGARLVVSAPGLPATHVLAEILREREISTLWLTAPLFHQMVDENPEELHGVRQLLAGGEALSVSHVRRAIAGLGSGCRLVNGYGPTENTTFTCCHVMDSESRVGLTVPIGRPISNTTVYVLDERMQPVPIGVRGELFVGGDGLAREYLNQPQLTAERFVPNPFARADGGRLYRTGDHVRYRADGSIEFLGRLDHQVKIRGYRIELGEIETALGEHPGVKDVVVLAREDDPGRKRLVAYVVFEALGEVKLSELRTWLQERLPRYMTPSSFVILDALPLNANGKVDRAALLPPDQTRADIEGEYVVPRTDVEAQLTRIWADVLGLDRVGVHDNFFELGGHSLMATQVVSRIRDTFGVVLPVINIFDSQTVAGLAERVENIRWALQGSDSGDSDDQHLEGAL